MGLSTDSPRLKLRTKCDKVTRESKQGKCCSNSYLKYGTGAMHLEFLIFTFQVSHEILDHAFSANGKPVTSLKREQINTLVRQKSSRHLVESVTVAV